EGHRADVVLVAVREHQGFDVVQAVPDVVEVRQDQVDPGLLLLREEHAAVDDQQPAGVLEDRHVPADLAEAAEGDDAQGSLGERRRASQIGARVAHADPSVNRSTLTALAGTAWCGASSIGPLTPAAASSSRISACSLEESSASGVRPGPPGRPN